MILYSSFGNPDWLANAFMGVCIIMAILHYWLVHENMIRKSEPYRRTIGFLYALGAIEWLFAGVLYHQQIWPARPMVLEAMICTILALALVSIRLWRLNKADGFLE